MNVTKRDGRVVPFDRNRIINAILLSMKETIKGTDDQLASRIADKIESENKDMSVEQIQDKVERLLMNSSRKEAAANYIRYRERRSMVRRQHSKFMDAVKQKLSASHVENQNANVDEVSFGGRRGEAASELTRQFALDNMLSQMSKNNHLNNEIYIHDFDSYATGMHNCLSIPFDDLLANGFTTRQTDVRPANSINTAFQLVAVIFQLQSLQQFGGVAATHLDWTMVPYVRKSFYKHYCDGIKYVQRIDYIFPQFDKDVPIDSELYKYEDNGAYQYAMDMTQHELKQAVEGMYHNLNTLQSRSGNQLESWLLYQ